MLFFREQRPILWAGTGVLGAGAGRVRRGGEKGPGQLGSCSKPYRTKSLAHKCVIDSMVSSGACSKIPGSVHRSQTVEGGEWMEGAELDRAGQKGAVTTPWRRGPAVPTPSLLPRPAQAGAWHDAEAGAAEGMPPLVPKLPQGHRCHSPVSDPSCYKLLLSPLLTTQPDTEFISHVDICSGENIPATRTYYLS